MLTKTNIKNIQDLRDKKSRDRLGLFLVEGEKSVAEVLQSNFSIEALFVSADFFEKYKKIITAQKSAYDVVEQGELEKISTLESNDAAVAVVHQKPNTPFTISKDELVLAIDTIRDPGNLGTIIRTADWYGITKIVASETTTEFYNPKTIAATMGSFTRVEFFYTKLDEFLKSAQLPVFGAFLDGKNIHTIEFSQRGILVVGNESHGITSSLASVITQKITIPRFGNAESLNVSIATGIILDTWKNSIR